MELRKTYIMRFKGADTAVRVVRQTNGEIHVETQSGEKIVDALVLDGGRTVSIRRDGRMDLIDITPPGSGDLRALVNGRGGRMQVLDELTAAAAEQRGSQSAASELRTPMPGLVVEVKVAVGDQVTSGQSLVVLEAMKMQNELAAPAAGVVAEIRCSKGQSVESGALLVRLEPEPTA
jgi:acetyl/propionyl-CoA carboxylase alpha subunit